MTTKTFCILFSSLFIFFISQEEVLGQAMPKQQGAGSAGKKIIKVDRFTALGKQCLVKTPEYETNIGRVPGRKEWYQITVEYMSTYPVVIGVVEDLHSSARITYSTKCQINTSYV